MPYIITCMFIPSILTNSTMAIGLPVASLVPVVAGRRRADVARVLRPWSARPFFRRGSETRCARLRLGPRPFRTRSSPAVSGLIIVPERSRRRALYDSVPHSHFPGQPFVARRHLSATSSAPRACMLSFIRSSEQNASSWARADAAIL